MKKTKKILALASSAVLLVTASVMGTMAYLQATTATVTNTFTVGNVSFEEGIGSGLDEAKVNEYGERVNADDMVDETADIRVAANTYKLIPGHKYVKDPTIHMADETEDCWLFVKVVNPIESIEATGSATIASQMATEGWTLVEGETDVYMKTTPVSAGADVVVFHNFTLADDAEVSAHADEQITIQAYAVQADGFASAQDAWDETYGKN